MTGRSLARLLTAGEDYEILAAVPPGKMRSLRSEAERRRRAGGADREARRRVDA